MIKSITEKYDSIISNEALIVGALKKSRVFSILTEEELIKISLLFEKLDFKDKEYIFMEGDQSNWVYIVAQDRVKTIKHTQSGRDIILEIKSPGEMFGCSTVLNKNPYTESAQAKGNATVIRISHENLVKIMYEYSFLKAGIANYLNNDLTDTYDMMIKISTETVEKRIILILLKHSEKANSENSGYGKIDFSLTRQEIAEMVGTTVETCIRIISKFRKLGIVKSSEKRMFVKTEPLEKSLVMNS